MTVHDWLARWSAWVWPLLANHLWQATLFSALCFLAVLLLKRGPSRTRHTIWLIAGLKFALPSALLLFLMESAGLRLPDWSGPIADGANPLAAVGQFTDPLLQGTAAGVGTSAASGHSELYCGLTLAWLSGVAILLALWVARRLQFSRAVRAGHSLISWREAKALHRALSLLGIPGDVDLIVSSGVNEPGVWRVLRPAIVLPAAMANDLTDAELEAVLLHELIHIGRRDNLVSNLHMMLCCLFWFHPLTWIIDGRLLNERERACDEAVIRLAGGSDVYASSLLKVLRFCLGWRVAGVSQAAGSNLRRRVERIMANDSDRKLRISHRVIVATVATLVVAFSIAAGLVSRGPVAAQVNPPQAPGRKGGVPKDGTERTTGALNVIDGGVTAVAVNGVAQARNVNQALMAVPESNIQFKNLEGSPVSITGASAKFLRIDKAFNRTAGISAPTPYLIRPNLTLVNNTDKRLTAVALEYETADGVAALYYFERLSSLIEPHASFTLNNRAAASDSDPASFVAKVAGVMFEDGTSWGDVPPPPPPPPPPPVPVERNGDASSFARSGASVVRKAGGGLQESVTKRIQPSYPPLAMAAQVSGAVVVEVLVDEEGNVSSARAVSGHPLLKDAAVEAAREWKFSPTSLDGKAVRVVGTITFNFAL
jgi:TonB family protein